MNYDIISEPPLPSGGVWLCVPGPCHCPEAAAEEDPGRPRAARRGAVRAVRAVPRDEAAAAPRHPPDHPRPHHPQQCRHSQQVDGMKLFQKMC